MEEELPAWSLTAEQVAPIELPGLWPDGLTRDWAWGGSTGAGVKVCILDSGVERGHPLVGEVQSTVAISVGDDGTMIVTEDEEGDLCGHGTACAGIVRSLAPDCEIHSVRVLGAGYSGSGTVLLAGLEHAIRSRYDVINMSLSTTKSKFANFLRELADEAYFRRAMLVASAHNLPIESYPWRFASVLSVASHEETDPLVFFANPNPPVELYARGVDVEAAWLGGGTLRVTGNSFATPHVSGICALVLGKHRGLLPFQLKTVLLTTASNVGGSR
jgi:subtilisin family serine protease